MFLLQLPSLVALIDTRASVLHDPPATPDITPTEQTSCAEAIRDKKEKNLLSAGDSATLIQRPKDSGIAVNAESENPQLKYKICISISNLPIRIQSDFYCILNRNSPIH